MNVRTFVAAALAISSSTGAAVTQYYGSQIQNPSGFATFTGYSYDPNGNPIQEGGMNFWMFGEGTSAIPGCGSDGYGYYSDGGGFHPAQITRVGGGNFGAVEFVACDGWNNCYNYGTIEAYLGGVLQGSFDVEGNASSTVYGVSGTFDEVRTAWFYDKSSRDQHDMYAYSAGEIDHVTWGGVPAPGSAAVLGLAGLTAGRRRR